MTRRAAAATTVWIVGAAFGVAVTWAQLPTKFTNLRVLPKDVAPRELVDTMKGLTRALHVRCQNCHVYSGNNPDDLATFDFARDDKELKRSARALMQMAARNGAAIDTVPRAGAPAPEPVAPSTSGAAAPSPTPAPTPRAPDGYDRFYRPLLMIDSAHSTIAFAVPFMGLSKTDGRFTDFAGALWFDPEDPASAAITVNIQAKSLDTALDERDEDLRSAQFFDVARFPRITFRSTRVERSGDTWTVSGPFTLHGVTREVTLPMRRIGDKLPDPWGNLRAGFEGTVTLHRADFGIAGNGRFSTLADFAIGPDVEVTLRVQAVQWNVAKWNVDAKSVVVALTPVLDGKGAAAAIAEYHRLRKEEADKWAFPEEALNLFGHRLMQAHRVSDALAMFTLNAEAFPASANAWRNVAVARAVNGDLAGAATAAHQSLALDDGEPAALELLRRLEPSRTGG